MKNHECPGNRAEAAACGGGGGNEWCGRQTLLITPVRRVQGFEECRGNKGPPPPPPPSTRGREEEGGQRG